MGSERERKINDGTHDIGDVGRGVGGREEGTW